MVSIEEGLIKDKIKSYIYQDCETLGMNAECKEKGNKSLPKNYIEVNDVKILIEVQDNKCYICKEPFKEYNAGCKNQLTLDRINSKNPHLKGNILLACWYCNCYGYNRQRECKYKCCNKSTSLRMKKDVPNEEILGLIDEYNKKTNGSFNPNDTWKDYEDDGRIIEVDDEGFTHTSFVNERASQNYFKMKFEFELYQHNNHICSKDCCYCLEEILRK